MDRNWEEGVNWKTLNPVGEFDNDADVVVHDDDNFVPIFIEDLIPVAEHRAHIQDKVEFEKLRDMLANHLQYMYQSGHLRWPKTRYCILYYVHCTDV